MHLPYTGSPPTGTADPPGSSVWPRRSVLNPHGQDQTKPTRTVQAHGPIEARTRHTQPEGGFGATRGWGLLRYPDGLPRLLGLSHARERPPAQQTPLTEGPAMRHGTLFEKWKPRAVFGKGVRGIKKAFLEEFVNEIA